MTSGSEDGIFDGLFERVDRELERSLEEKRYVLACYSNPWSLSLFNTESEKIVWKKDIRYVACSAAVGKDGIYVGTKLNGIYRINSEMEERINIAFDVGKLITRGSGLIAMDGNRLIDLASGEEVRIEVPDMRFSMWFMGFAKWIFSDEEKDYLHYTNKNKFIIAEIDLETGRTGKEVFKGRCKDYLHISQTEKIGDWLLTAGENYSLMAVKKLRYGWKSKKRLYRTSREIYRFVVVEKGDVLEMYVGGYEEFVKIVTDREFRDVEVRDLWEKVGEPRYFLPLALLSKYEVMAHIGAGVE